VVPSPASEVFGDLAHHLRALFSESWSSISLATMTPSPVTVGNRISLDDDVAAWRVGVTLTVGGAAVGTPGRLLTVADRFGCHICCSATPFDDREHFVLAEDRCSTSSIPERSRRTCR
jgi:hypothetical protein